MRKLLKVNVVLTLVISFVLLVSFKPHEEEIRYTHHFEEVKSITGRTIEVLVKNKYRKFEGRTGGYGVLICPPGTVFNCFLERCNYYGCPCVGDSR